MLTLFAWNRLHLKQWVVAVAILTMVTVSMGACRQENRAKERLAEDSAAAREIDSNLTFNNITLEQADEKGQLLWQVRSTQAIYSQDRKVAQVQNPDGELFQDGKPVVRVRARRGEVRDNGKRILLRGQIVATDLKSGAILRGDQMEWNPEQGVMIVRNHVRGSHPRLKLSANQGRLLTKKRQIELSGQVVAVASDPAAQLQGEHLTWNMDAETLISDRPIKIDRLQGTQITDTASGGRATFNLKTKVATLEQNTQLILANPPVQVSGNRIVWNMKAQTAGSDQPISVIHRQQQVTITASRGQMDIQKRIFYLSGNVRALAQRNQSRLMSDRLDWHISTQELFADGNVDYQQSNPPVTVRGPKAVGKLENQTVVLSGGRVVTEVIPNRPLVP